MLIPIVTIVALLTGGPAAPVDSFSGKPRLEVEVRDTSGMPVPGTNVALCPVDRTHPAPPAPGDPAYWRCGRGYTDAQGVARFDPVPPGAYAVTASLEGFATTSVYPLLVGGEQPVAPDRVRLLLVAGQTRCGVLPDDPH
ncbi:MAG: carboxypeptidase-like regulatory domain-containing protein [Acidobacteriota bacterium]